MTVMDKEEEVRDYTKVRVENLLRQSQESDIYTPDNKKLILEFYNTCKAKGLSTDRICFYLNRLKLIAKIRKKDFKEFDRKDVEAVMAEVGSRGYSPHSVECIKTTFKAFFRWLNELERTDPSPKIVRWLHSENIPSKLKKEDLITKKEMADMLNASNNPMHKALLAVLWAGPRPGEALTIKLENIKKIDGLIKIYVSGKMGKKQGKRPIYILDYQQELLSWLRGHPRRHDPEASLFLVESGKKRLGYNSANHIVARMAKRAGLKKGKVPLYRFRHGAGTRYYGKYEGSYARRLMGHAAGSKMEAVYCHLSEQDVEARLLGKTMIEDSSEPDIPFMEQETDELLKLGKAIKKLAESHPEAINLEILAKLSGA